jgi:hypothetical protein
MDINAILTYLTENKLLLVGAVAALTEVLAIVINFWRKVKAEATAVKVYGGDHVKVSAISKLLWSANPINLFRKIK